MPNMDKTNNTTEQKPLPKWFNGARYTQWETVTNPFSGQSELLSPNEVAMYDLIMGLTMTLERTGYKSEKLMKDHRRGLDWFRVANPEAYMTLLD
ncbi:hypothetical protein DRO61_09340 [Candidatus Bathyarchaeota archaeon]|nr:MAG: hypothetical protein DRO61_09340 [Candidatus Bathyarchaeota archaeon]